MNKRMIRKLGIMMVLDLVLGIVLSLYITSTGTLPAADNAAVYADGTYTARAQGCVSEVAVTVVITGGKVCQVSIDAEGETPALGGRAAETLAPALLEAGGTAGVDSVSGSTMTSDAVFTAMDACLAQAAQ